MDDILLFGATFEEHKNRLNKVSALGDAGLVLNTKECIFSKKKNRLGHVFDSNVIIPGPTKTYCEVSQTP
jgi:hypothetical protein